MSKSTSGKAQTAAMAVAIARICNAAWRRFPAGHRSTCATLAKLLGVQRRHGAVFSPHPWASGGPVPSLAVFSPKRPEAAQRPAGTTPFCTRLRCHRQLDLRDAGGIATFHLLDGRQQVTLEFLVFRGHLRPLASTAPGRKRGWCTGHFGC